MRLPRSTGGGVVGLVLGVGLAVLLGMALFGRPLSGVRVLVLAVFLGPLGAGVGYALVRAPRKDLQRSRLALPILVVLLLAALGFTLWFLQAVEDRS